METKIQFKERQRFKQWWLWLLIIGLSGATIFSLVYQIIYEQSVGHNPMSDKGLVITSALILMLNGLFLAFKLETRMDQDGIHVRFFPFHIKFRTYCWSDVAECKTRQYSPIGEYGGWGLRGWGANRALNVSGNQGVQITFKNGNMLLIGTQAPDLANEAIQELFKPTE